MSSLPLVADIEKIADSLTGKDRQRLRGLANSLMKAQSCIADLRLVQQSCEVLSNCKQNFDKLKDLDRAMIQHSLLSNAIVFYARAAAGEAKRGGRGSHTVADQLPPDLQEAHKTVIGLRNRVVAHVHSNDQLRGEAWNQSHAFIVSEGVGIRVGAAASPIKIRDTVREDLEKLAPAAEAIIQTRYRSYLAKVEEMLQSMTRSAVARSLVDPVELFGRRI